MVVANTMTERSLAIGSRLDQLGGNRDAVVFGFSLGGLGLVIWR